MTSVRVGGVTFQIEGTGPGFYILDDGFDGWIDGPGTRLDKTDVPQGHGAFDGPMFRQGRLFDVSGECLAGSLEQLTYFGSRFTGILADGQSGPVYVDHGGLSTWANARLADAPQFKVTATGIRATFAIQFWFADPRKYGDVNAGTPGVSPGEVLSHHYGNFGATSVLTVTGSAPGYTIYGPGGRAYVVTVPVVTGHPHSIDMKTSFLSIDGVKQFGAVARADTWTVPPGQTVSQSVLPTSGAVTLTVSTVDTYI